MQASAAADLVLCNAGHPSLPKGNMRLVADYSIRPSDVIAQSAITRSTPVDLRCDSIGFYHNYVMMRVNQNKDLFLSNGQVDLNSLYDAVIYYFKEVGVFSEPLQTDEFIKYELKQFIYELAMITLQSINNSESASQLMDRHCLYLNQHCMLTNDELSVHRQFVQPVAIKCSELSPDQIHIYAQQLNYIIVNSNLPQEVKEEVAFSAMTTVNSALCWQQ